MFNSSTDLRTALAGILKSGETPVVLCGLSPSADRVTLHVTHSGPPGKLREAAETALRSAGIECAVKVSTISARAMTRSVSLDALLRPVAGDSIIHDPTAVFGRASALVAATAAARRELGKLVRGVFLDPVGRNLFVVMPVNRDLAQLQAECQRIGKVFDDAIETAAAAIGSIQINRPPIRVRVVTELPARTVVAVDAISARQTLARLGLRRRLAVMAAAIGLIAVPGLALASRDLGPSVGAVDQEYRATAQGHLVWADPNAVTKGGAELKAGVSALPGLSVFSDGGGFSTFTEIGFRHYFGVQVAETNFTRPPRAAPADPNDMGAAGFGTSGGAPSS